MSEYRIPPYTVQQVLLAHEMRDQIGWGQKAVGVEKAWLKTKGRANNGDRVRVAVLDTGVDSDHLSRDLQNVVEHFDVTGYGPYDSDGHGTHCLGIVGADADNEGVVGFLPEAELISIRCMANNVGSDQWIARALDTARGYGCHIVSMSLGSPDPSPRIAASLEKFVASGGFVVAAAGNDGKRRSHDVNFPARWKGPHGRPNLDTIAVAATEAGGRLAPYSSRGPEVDIAAPGSDIVSCWLNGGYAKISGTSMACPAVAGLIGLLLVHHWNLGSAAKSPIKTHEDLREHLKRAAVDIGQPGRDDGTGWGLVDADKLIAEEQQTAAPIEDVIRSIKLAGVTIHRPARAGDKIGLTW